MYSQAYQSDPAGTANSSKTVQDDQKCDHAQKRHKCHHAQKRHKCNTSLQIWNAETLPFNATMALCVQDKRVLETHVHASAPDSCVHWQLGAALVATKT